MSSGRGSSGGRGRGAYYRAKYGGGRGGSSGGSGHGEVTEAIPKGPRSTGIQDWEALTSTLRKLDGSSYGAYKTLLGSYTHSNVDFQLTIDFVQSDPFAAPSRVRVLIDAATCNFPSEFYQKKIRRIALADHLTRVVASSIRSKHLDEDITGGGGGWSGPKGGAFNINAPGQEVLERTSCLVHSKTSEIELRFTVRLPARGRTILGQEAAKILAQALPELVKECLLYRSPHHKALKRHINIVEQQEMLRGQLMGRGFVAFVANGAILPRKSGFQSLPMTGPGVVPFQSPKAFEVTLKGLDGSPITGMGIRTGVTVLTGGGFHGKSTLLEALQMGIYNHVPDDGRENVVTDDTAFKIRAEDGRSVKDLDISPFISSLPGKNTSSFSSEDASGSTSMASNMQEALELGSKLLLIDEDSSATNLLVRDARMQELIRAEPITPFVSKVRALYTQHGVSSIIVIGGCGDYLSVADAVVGMQSYQPHDLTDRAREIVKKHPAAVKEHETYGQIPDRIVEVPRRLSENGSPVARSLGFIEVKMPRTPASNPAEGKAGIDLSGIEQLVEQGQVRYIAEALMHLASTNHKNPHTQTQTLPQLMSTIETSIAEHGLDSLHDLGWVVGDTVVARRFELGAAIARLRV